MIHEVFESLFIKLAVGGRIAINIPYEVNFKNQGQGRCFIASEYWQILKSIGYGWAGIADLSEDNPHIKKRSSWGSWLLPSAPYIYNPKECVLICYKEQWKKKNKGKSYFNDSNKKEFMQYVIGKWPYRAETKKWTEANYSLDIPLTALKMLTWENDLVYDPFIGSGTTALACELLNRKWMGSEISKNYCEVARKRLVELTRKDMFFNETKNNRIKS
jgi:site-specific DNA-methyltransferase (adenine-specific)